METRTCDRLKLKEDGFYCNRPPFVAATTAASTSNIADAARTWPARALAPSQPIDLLFPQGVHPSVTLFGVLLSYLN